MPCHECKVEANARSDDPPSTPTKSTGNDGAGADHHNDSTDSENSSDSDLSQVKQKRRRTPLDYVLIKQWVTGEKAAMDDEDIDNENRDMASMNEDYMDGDYYGDEFDETRNEYD